MDKDGIFNVVVCGVLSWTMLFYLLRTIFSNRSFDFSNRLVSTIHATIAVILASLSVQDWCSPVSPLASTCSPKQVPYTYIYIYVLYIYVSFLHGLNIAFIFISGKLDCRWKHSQLQLLISYMI